MNNQIIHLKHLINFVHQIPNLSDGWSIVQNSLLQKLQEKNIGEKKLDSKRCPRCFTLWNEGRYTVQSKAKTKIRKNKRLRIPTKRFIIKCLICSHKKYMQLSCQQPSFKTTTKKVKNVKLKRTEEKSEFKENDEKMGKKSEITKRLNPQQNNKKTNEDNLEMKENSKIKMKLKQKKKTKTIQTKNQKGKDIKTKDKLKKVNKLKQKGRGIKITKSKGNTKEKNKILTFLKDFIQ